MKKSIKSLKRTKKSKQNKTKKPKITSQSLRKAVGKSLTSTKPPKTHESDRVLEALPDWIPEPEKRRFIIAKNALIEEYSVEKIHRLMVSRRRMYQGGFSWSPHLSPESEERVDTLNDIKSLVDLGEKKRIKAHPRERKVQSSISWQKNTRRRQERTHRHTWYNTRKERTLGGNAS